MKHKFLYMLLSLVVAFGLWIYVVSVVSPESEGVFYDIPVVLSNQSVLMDKGFMVVSDGMPKMTLQLRGNRSDLNNLKNSDITIMADLSRINAPGEQMLSCNISFAGNNFEIVNSYPSKITLQIAEWATKEVPIRINYTGTLGLDYIAFQDEAVLDRETITITGPKTTVDEITQARIDVNLTGQTVTFSESYRYTLCNDQGAPVDASSVTTNAAQVNLTLKIQRVKEIQLLVDVIYKDSGATEENTQIIQDYLTIKVAGSEAALNSLGNVLKIGTIDLSKELEDTEKVFKVNLPEGIENLSGIREVTAQIFFKDLDIKEVTVTDIHVYSEVEGVTVTLDTQALPITLRGPKELVAQISAENISVLVTLKEYQPGQNICKAEIVVNSEKFPGVEAVGTYVVLVNVAEAGGAG